MPDATRTVWNYGRGKFSLTAPRNDHQVGSWTAGKFYESSLRSPQYGLVDYLYQNLSSLSHYFKGRVIDIGACFGNHSVFFAGVLGAKVFAVEPNLIAYNYLTKNIEQNGLQSLIYPRNQLIGTESKTLVSPPHDNLGMTRFQAGTDILPVELDNFYIEDRPTTYVKIDAEGMEIEVLESGLGLIENDLPMLSIETDRPDDVSALLNLNNNLYTRLPLTLNYTPTYIWLPTTHWSQR